MREPVKTLTLDEISSSLGKWLEGVERFELISGDMTKADPAE